MFKTFISWIKNLQSTKLVEPSFHYRSLMDDWMDRNPNGTVEEYRVFYEKHQSLFKGVINERGSK